MREVIGNRADRIGQRPQIGLAVLVVVEREFAVVARHELRVAHRAGVRALGLARIDAAIAAQREEFDQFAEEERARSEEHTSELQSLMRISYAVFCLKKTTTTKSKTHQQQL